MKKILFDTNVILDIALKREPFFEHISGLFSFIDQGKIKGHITATTITDIYYIFKKEKGHDSALDFISNLIGVVDVIGIDKETILQSLKSGIKDFEDAIQVTASDHNNIEVIITRNIKDFKKSQIPVYTPEEFIAFLQK